MSGDFSAPVAPAAWHPDPQDPSRQRWWNGTEWTENVRAATMLPPIGSPHLIDDTPPAAAETRSEAMPPLPPDSPFARAEQPASPFAAHNPPTGPSVASAADAPSPFPPPDPIMPWTARPTGPIALEEPSGYIPMSTPVSSWNSDNARISAPSKSTFTPGLVLIGLLALVHLAIVYLVLTVLGDVDLNSAARSALVFGPLVLYIGAATWDSRTLGDRGHAAPPFAILAVLPPLYLLIRAFRAPWSSLGILVVWSAIEGAAIALLLSSVSVTVFGITVGASVASPGSVGDTATNSPAPSSFEAPFTAEKRAYILTPQGMAEKLAYDYGVAGVVVNDITCEPLSSTEPTSQTLCSGTLLGTPLLITVVVGNDDDPSVSPIFVAG